MPHEHEQHIPSRAEIVIGKAADACRRWLDRREFARFAQDCPAEADRLAKDLNVDKASLIKIAGQGREPPALLNRRLRVLGIDAKHLQRVEPRVAQDLARCCALCDCKSRCARDLARQPDNANWRTYCPNAHTLEALRPHPAAP
jgi:hypothetical protein